MRKQETENGLPVAELAERLAMLSVRGEGSDRITSQDARRHVGSKRLRQQPATQVAFFLKKYRG